MMSRWRELLPQAVTPFEDGVRGLDVINYRAADAQDYRPERTAAVLVALLDQDEPELVLTRRADHLPHHPGQVSFPGGRMEEADGSAVQTALREANEEIGLDLSTARPLGFLDRIDTISEYRVLPVVALVQPPVKWVPDASEVADVFTVPLSVVLDFERYESRKMRVSYDRFVMYSLQWDGFNIWGATARILINFLSRMQNAHGG